MPKRNKMRCFHCGREFKDTLNIFRNRIGWPVCEDCCYEDIDMDFDDPEPILEQLRSEFNRSYKKFLKYLKTECKICPECDTWYPLNYFVDDICQSCFEHNIDNNNIKETNKSSEGVSNVEKVM